MTKQQPAVPQNSQPELILASKSKHRAMLLAHLGLSFRVQPADVDETELKGETPLAYVRRVAISKALKVHIENPGCVVLAADTPVVLGRRILQTPQTREEAETMLRAQSGRRVHIPTVVVVVDAKGKVRHKTAQGWLKMKRLSRVEIENYLNRDNWHHVSGALQVEEFAIEPWIRELHGSYSGIIGLPLYETSLLLQAAGITTTLGASGKA